MWGERMRAYQLIHQLDCRIYAIRWFHSSYRKLGSFGRRIGCSTLCLWRLRWMYRYRSLLHFLRLFPLVIWHVDSFRHLCWFLWVLDPDHASVPFLDACFTNVLAIYGVDYPLWTWNGVWTNRWFQSFDLLCLSCWLLTFLCILVQEHWTPLRRIWFMQLCSKELF